MATYGGGIDVNFVESFANLGINSASSTVVYTCPVGKYVWLRLKSLSMPSGTSYTQGTVNYRLQADNGLGGWVDVVNETGWELNGFSSGGASPIIATGKYTQDQQGFFLMVPGTRLMISNGSGAGGTVRLSYTAVEFSASV